MSDNIFSMENILRTGILSTVDSQHVFAALAEPNRLRIVQLLAVAPRTVGEIAQALDIRQPQTSKHLQTLESAGVVVVHRLGRRRVAALQRGTVRELADLLAVLGVANPSETVLEQYELAVRVEEQRLLDAAPVQRTFEIRRIVMASQTTVWRAWTTADLARQWWSPEHFEVAECVVEAVAGGRIDLTVQEADGTQYRSTGQVLGLVPGRTLTFTQAPLGADDAPVFSAIHDLELEAVEQGTAISLTIRVHDSTETAAPALAGIPLGWEQCLDKLAALVKDAG